MVERFSQLGSLWYIWPYKGQTTFDNFMFSNNLKPNLLVCQDTAAITKNQPTRCHWSIESVGHIRQDSSICLFIHPPLCSCFLLPQISSFPTKAPESARMSWGLTSTRWSPLWRDDLYVFIVGWAQASVQSWQRLVQACRDKGAKQIYRSNFI